MIQTQAPTIEAIRRRARQRLIGAGVLVLVGVVVLPLLFDRQPRPVPVPIHIDIPDRQDTPSMTLPASEPSGRNTSPVTAVPAVSSVTAAAPQTVPDQSAPSSAEPAPLVGVSTQAPMTPPAASARALPEAPNAIRLVVQVGAFADPARVQEVRQRLERAGLKTYTQVVQTPEGRRTRVRVGPFDSRAEADRVAARIQQLGLQPTILTL